MLHGFGVGRYAMAVTESGLPLIPSGGPDAWGLATQIARHGGITEEYLDRYRPEVIMFHAYYSPLEPPERGGLGARSVWYRRAARCRPSGGPRLPAGRGREAASPIPHSYYVRPGFAEADAVYAAIRDFDYAWYQDGMPANNFARTETEARP